MRPVAALLSAVCASSLLGQTAGTVTGTVATQDGTPVASARIRVVGTALAAVADARGVFRIAGVPAVHQTLDIRMIGYTPVSLPIEIVADTTFDVRVVLAPVPLDAIDVETLAGATPALRGFEERMQHGPGTFFTRESILRMQARAFTDILRRVPGLQVRRVSGMYGDNFSVMLRGRHCPMTYYMNGSPFRVPADVPINHFITPDEVVAVEVYSASEIPSQFNASANRAMCGVVVVWTRVGIEPRRSRDDGSLDQ